MAPRFAATVMFGFYAATVVPTETIEKAIVMASARIWAILGNAL